MTAYSRICQKFYITGKGGFVMEICKGYCGVACVGGYCPKVFKPWYSCEDRFYYQGCDDCYFLGMEDCIRFDE